MNSSKHPIDLILYVLLFCGAVFVNKYVLSVLNFTYPTIFQGWQTLVGGLLLRLMLAYNCFSVSATPLDKSGFISLLPSFLFFSAGIVASSKALASLSIPVYLCMQNTLSALLYMLEIAPTFQGGQGPLALLASIITCSTAVLAVLADIDLDADKLKFSESPYFWMIVNLACVAVQTLHSKIADARYTEIDRLYFSYIFSVVVLAPASLYLEEAFEVLHFPHTSRYDFYAGCLLSGVLGLFLSLSAMKVRQQTYFAGVDGAGKLLTSCLSLIAFVDKTSHVVKLLVFSNLVAAVFVPLPVPKDVNQSNDEQTEPFIKQPV